LLVVRVRVLVQLVCTRVALTMMIIRALAMVIVVVVVVVVGTPG
jgi:hypothetical protein